MRLRSPDEFLNFCNTCFVVFGQGYSKKSYHTSRYCTATLPTAIIVLPTFRSKSIVFMKSCARAPVGLKISVQIGTRVMEMIIAPPIDVVVSGSFTFRPYSLGPSYPTQDFYNRYENGQNRFNLMQSSIRYPSRYTDYANDYRDYSDFSGANLTKY